MSDDQTPGQQAQAAAETIAARYFGEADPAPAPEPPKADPAPAPAEPKAESLAETIRREREARAQAAAASQAVSTKDRRIAELEAQLKAVQEGDDPLTDPVGWAKHRKYTPDQQSLLGQALLYDLVPDKAPGDMRVKLLEARIARDKAEATAQAEAARAEAERGYQTQQFNQYAATVQAAVTASEAGSYPETEAWFGEDTDTRVRSLLATADNLAGAARKTGTVADLTPGNVARVLEAEMASRMARRDQRRGAAPPKQADPAPQAAAQTAPARAVVPNVTSTKGMAAGGPRPPAATDRERLERAIAAGFGAR